MRTAPAACLLLLAACGGGSAQHAVVTPAPAAGAAKPAPPPADHTLGGSGYGYGGAWYGGFGYGDDAALYADILAGGDSYGAFGHGGWGLVGGGEPGGMVDGVAGGFVGGSAVPVDPDAELAAYLPTDIKSAARPDPAATYAVPIAHSPVLGPDTALVTIVSSYELNDPYSPRLLATLDALASEYAGEVRLVAKSYIVHPATAQVGALAVCAASQQGQGPAFLRALLGARFGTDGSGRDDSVLTVPGARRVAQSQGLEMVKWEADLRGPRCKEEVIADQRLLASLGAHAVPQSWINGRFISGAVPAGTLKPIIDEELAKATKATKGSKAKRRGYYASVVKKGKTTTP